MSRFNSYSIDLYYVGLATSKCTSVKVLEPFTRKYCMCSPCVTAFFKKMYSYRNYEYIRLIV